MPTHRVDCLVIPRILAVSGAARAAVVFRVNPQRKWHLAVVSGLIHSENVTPQWFSWLIQRENNTLQLFSVLIQIVIALHGSERKWRLATFSYVTSAVSRKYSARCDFLRCHATLVR